MWAAIDIQYLVSPTELAADLFVSFVRVFLACVGLAAGSAIAWFMWRLFRRSIRGHLEMELFNGGYDSTQPRRRR